MDRREITVIILLKLAGSFSPMHYWFVLSTITIACHGTRAFKGHTSAQRWLASWCRSDKLDPQCRTSPIPYPTKLYLSQFHSPGASVWYLRAFHMYRCPKACKDGRLWGVQAWSAVEVRLPTGLHTATVQVIRGRELRCRAGSSWAQDVSLGQTFLILKAKFYNRKMT